MLWLAATTLEKLQNVPKRFWVNAVLALVAAAVLILAVRHAARMNKFVLTMIFFLLITVVGMQWIYERNEPRFLTPTIDKIAPFFPSKIQYKEYQQPK